MEIKEKQPNPDNPWFGIPADISGKFTTNAEAENYWATRSTPTTPTPGVAETGATTPPTPGVASTPSFEQSFNQASGILDQGVSTPMTPADIRAREAQEREARRLQAESIFNPQIARAEDIGGRQIGSAKGQFGVSRGLGLSTAEMTYVNNLEKQVQDRISEVRKEKESYIATGDFEAMQRADAAIEKLQERQDNILFQKTQLAMNLMGEQRQQQMADLAVQQYWTTVDQFNQTFAFQKEQFASDEEQRALSNAVAIAGLTGEFMGAKTVQEQQRVVENAFKQMGYDLEVQKFDEIVRSNKFQEQMQLRSLALKGASGGAGSYTESDIQMANGLLQQVISEGGAFDAVTFNELTKGLDNNTRARVTSLVLGQLGTTAAVEEGLGMESIPGNLGAFGFPTGTSLGEAVGSTIREVPSALASGFQWNMNFYNDLIKGLFNR